jgi:hypothetical protein
MEERKMSHQLKIWSAGALSAVLSCTTLAFAGNNDPMTITRITTDIPVADQHFTNDCNGEDVVLNGTIHSESTIGRDADGDRTIYDLDTTSRLVGEGQTTHARYVALEKIHQHDTTRGGQASNTRSAQKLRLVAQGPTQDLISRFTMHTVISKDGTILVQKENESLSCK